MELPLSITYRNMESSPAIEARIREHAAKLDRLFPRIMSCRVVVEAPHRRHHKGKLYQVSIDLKMPGKEIAVTSAGPNDHTHEDIYVAIRDAFNALARRVQDKARVARGTVKTHEGPIMGKVVRLFTADGYGFALSSDGQEVYFHRNSVVGTNFDALDVGSQVRLALVDGEKGAQASTVAPIHKPHPASRKKRERHVKP